MKGTVFQRPLELNLIVDGESWKQSEEIKGTLKIKNHGPDSLSLNEFGVRLAWGEFKKIKKKNEKAFKTELSQNFKENIQIAPNQEQEFSWEFSLDENCPVTDKAGSLYLLYGKEEIIWEGGLLQLSIQPKDILMQFLDFFGKFYRFNLKGIKSKEGYIEARLVPPSSREFTTVDGLKCLLRILEKNLEIKYSFDVKVLDFAGGSTNLIKKKMEFEQVLTPKEYLIFGDTPNQDGIIKAIGEILEQVKSKTTF